MMKFKNYVKLVLPTVMAALLVSIPTVSDAYTIGYSNYSNAYNATRTTYSNTITIKPDNEYYTTTKNSNQTGNNTSKNYYVVSRGDYSRPQYNTNKPVEKPQDNTNTPVEKPVENVQPKPQDPKPQPTPQPAPNPNAGSNTGSTSNANHSLSAAEIQMVELVNKERQAAGLNALQIDAELSYVARIKSQDMSDNKYFSHDSPTYGSPFDMMNKFGIKYRGAAENIAKNNSVASAHNSLMRSSGHKANIMNPNYTHIGIGIHNGHYTQMFISK